MWLFLWHIIWASWIPKELGSSSRVLCWYSRHRNYWRCLNKPGVPIKSVLTNKKPPDQFERGLERMKLMMRTPGQRKECSVNIVTQHQNQILTFFFGYPDLWGSDGLRDGLGNLGMKRKQNFGLQTFSILPTKHPDKRRWTKILTNP